jgi:hypothetical protein
MKKPVYRKEKRAINILRCKVKGCGNDLPKGFARFCVSCCKDIEHAKRERRDN